MSVWKQLSEGVNEDNLDFYIGSVRQQLEKDLTTQDKVSDCVVYAPRLRSCADKKFKVAKKIAFSMYPHFVDQIQKNKDPLLVRKHAYILYTQILRKLTHAYEKQCADEKELTKVIKLHGIKDLRENYDTYDKQDVSNVVTEPIPMPVDVAPIDELNPFFDQMRLNIPVIGHDYIEFTRGAQYSDGRIDLCKQVVGSEHIKALMDSIRENEHVKHFLLGNNVIDSVGAKSIADFITQKHAPKIETWYIAGNKINTEGVTILAKGFENDTDAKSLWLKRNPLNPEGGARIGYMLTKNSSLVTLDLHNTNCGDDGCISLFNDLKQNTTLRTIYLDANNIGLKGAKAIAEYYTYLTKTNNTGVENLWMGMNRLRDTGVIKIVEAIKTYTPMKRLDLGSCRITTEGARIILDMLENHPNLIFLDLGMYKATGDMGELPNNITDLGVEYIRKFLEHNRSVQVLDISHNGISDTGLNTILDGFESNPTLLYLYYDQYGSDVKSNTKKRARMLMERNIQNVLKINFDEFHKQKLRYIKHTEDIWKIDSIYRNRMK